MTSLVEKLTQKKQPSRVIFLSMQDEIVEALNAGWTLKDMWRQLKEDNRFDFSYGLFLRHYNRYLQDKHTSPRTQEEESQPANNTGNHLPKDQPKVVEKQPIKKTPQPTVAGKKQPVFGNKKTESFEYNPEGKSDADLY